LTKLHASHTRMQVLCVEMAIKYKIFHALLLVYKLIRIANDKGGQHPTLAVTHNNNGDIMVYLNNSTWKNKRISQRVEKTDQRHFPDGTADINDTARARVVINNRKMNEISSFWRNIFPGNTGNLEQKQNPAKKINALPG